MKLEISEQKCAASFAEIAHPSQIYTQVSITKLQQVYAESHPAAKERKEQPAEDPAAREALMATLKKEADEEDGDDEGGDG